MRVLDELGISTAEADAILSAIMFSIAGSKLQDINEYLLMESHFLVQDYYAHCVAKVSACAGVSNSELGAALCSTWGVLTEHSVTQKAAQRARKAPRWSGGR